MVDDRQGSIWKKRIRTNALGWNRSCRTSPTSNDQQNRITKENCYVWYLLRWNIVTATIISMRNLFSHPTILSACKWSTEKSNVSLPLGMNLFINQPTNKGIKINQLGYQWWQIWDQGFQPTISCNLLSMEELLCPTRNKVPDYWCTKPLNCRITKNDIPKWNRMLPHHHTVTLEFSLNVISWPKMLISWTKNCCT